MIQNKFKLYWTNGEKKKICDIPYDDAGDYSAFLQKCKSKGYRQVIITSDVMLQLIRDMCIRKGRRVSEIEFAKEDPDFDGEIKKLIQEIESNDRQYAALMEMLHDALSESSVDVKKLSIRNGRNDDKKFSFYLQSNGILEASTEDGECKPLTNEIDSIVEGCLA